MCPLRSVLVFGFVFKLSTCSFKDRFPCRFRTFILVPEFIIAYPCKLPRPLTRMSNWNVNTKSTKTEHKNQKQYSVTFRKNVPTLHVFVY